MKAYSLFIIICCICRYTSIEIKPELEKNISKFGYGINYKYEGMLAHSFDRFYVVIKFISSTINDLKFSKIKYDEACKHFQKEKGCSTKVKEHILDLIQYYRKIRPLVEYYQDQSNSFNHTVHNILTNEIGLIVPKYIERKGKLCVITLLISGFIGLVCEGIPSFLHHRRHKALHKTVKAMENKADIQHKLMHLEDTMVMYGIYNAENFRKTS